MIYKRIEAYLEENGLKQHIIAELCGYSLHTFRSILNGNRVIKVDDIEKICSVLMVPPDTFIKPMYKNKKEL